MTGTQQNLIKQPLTGQIIMTVLNDKIDATANTKHHCEDKYASEAEIHQKQYIYESVNL